MFYCTCNYRFCEFCYLSFVFFLFFGVLLCFDQDCMHNINYNFKLFVLHNLSFKFIFNKDDLDLYQKMGIKTNKFDPFGEYELFIDIKKR